jgi:lysozyme family protein
LAIRKQEGMMQHPFESLAGEYASLLARMQVTRQSAVESVANKLMNFVRQGRYAEVSNQLGIPQVFIATSFERESSSDFSCSPAQGDPWNRVSVHVPRGRGPFPNWTAAALDAYRLDRLDQVGKANWTWPRFCYEGELFNGFGYRAHGVNSPYLWAGSNNYTTGKFVSDGVFDMGHADTQLGVVPVARAMVAMDPSLDLPAGPGATAAPGPTAAPASPSAPPPAPQPRRRRQSRYHVAANVPQQARQRPAAYRRRQLRPAHSRGRRGVPAQIQHPGRWSRRPADHRGDRKGARGQVMIFGHVMLYTPF